MRQMLALVGVVSVLSGCSMIGAMQSAKTAGEGNLQVGLEPGVWGVGGEGTDGLFADGGAGFLPTFNVALRYGVTDRLDLGGRIGAGMPQITAKVMFTDPTADGVQISIAPMVGFFMIGGSDGAAGYLDLNVPVLVGIPAGKSEFILGPRLHAQNVFGGGGGESVAATFVSAGTSIGYALQASDRFKVIPEVAIEYPFLISAAASGEGSATETGIGGYFFNVGVGLVLGGR